MPALASVTLAAATLVSRPARAADPPTVSDCLVAAETSLKLRAEHKLRLTRTQLLVCASASCPAEVRSECNKRIDEVNAASPTIVLAVKDGAGHELTAVKVTVDGQPFADHLDGSALSIDPGAHEFTFETPGVAPVTETIVLHEGEKARRENVVLGPAAPAKAHAAAVDLAPQQGAPDAGENPGGGQRAVGLVLGGLGIAGGAVGAVFGLLASSAWNDAKNECPSHTGCSQKALDDHGSATTDATISTVGFIAGGVLLATGVTLYFTAPHGEAATVGVVVRPGGVSLQGGF